MEKGQDSREGGGPFMSNTAYMKGKKLTMIKGEGTW